MATETNAAIDAVWRIESPRLIAGLARMVRDVGVAEDLAHDALVAALEQWPESGVPDNPGAWLMAIGKRRAIDHFRRAERLERRHEELGRRIETEQEMDLESAIDDIEDDLLRLVFTACHPLLSTEARVALTLRLLGGLTTEEIAPPFPVPEATLAQRIVRAKRRLAALERAEELGDASGPYTLQAAIAACHARANTPEQTDWPRIAALYAALAQQLPSPIVELNRAVAVGMAFGPDAGLQIVDELTSHPSLKTYHFLPSDRGDLLKKHRRPEQPPGELKAAPTPTR